MSVPSDMHEDVSADAASDMNAAPDVRIDADKSAGVPLIEVQAGGVTYPTRGGSPPVRALCGVDFRLMRGGHCALLGENGAGKSTLLRVLAGLEWLTEGRVVWHSGEGAETSPLAGRQLCALLSAAQQEQYLRHEWDISGEDALCTAFADSSLLYSRPSEEQRRKAREIARFLGVEGLLKHGTVAMSQGQLRVVLLGRALLREPQVLLLDEYTDGMDATLRARMPQILARAAERATLVVTAHRAETIPDFVRQHVWVWGGTVHTAPASACASVPEFLSAPEFSPASACADTTKTAPTPESASPSASPDAPKAARAAALAPGVPAVSPPSVPVAAQCVSEAPVFAVSALGAPVSPTAPSLLSGDFPACSECSSFAEDAALLPLVRITNATVYVHRVPVLHEINWTWRQGEHWQITGANGAGKSTFLRLLAGDAYPAAGGSIWRFLPRHQRTEGAGRTDDGEYAGGAGQAAAPCMQAATASLSPADVGENMMLARLRRGVRLVSDAQQALCYPHLTGLELVLCGWDNTAEPYRDFTPEESRAALAAMGRLGVDVLAGRRAGTLSTGQLRRLFLCRALMGTPDMLLLDEPCSGLDASARRQVSALLQEAVLRGAHILMVTHHAADVLPCITRTARMQEGRLFLGV